MNNWSRVIQLTSNIQGQGDRYRHSSWLASERQGRCRFVKLLLRQSVAAIRSNPVFLSFLLHVPIPSCLWESEKGWLHKLDQLTKFTELCYSEIFFFLRSRGGGRQNLSLNDTKRIFFPTSQYEKQMWTCFLVKQNIYYQVNSMSLNILKYI